MQPGERSNDDHQRLPTDPGTGEPLQPRTQPGYYPGFSTLGQQRFWDAATREVVRKRLHQIPPIRFFTPEEARLMEILCEHLMPQDDRDSNHRIAILPFIDERLHEGRTPGYRFEVMPPDGDAYRLGLQAIEQMSHANHQRSFLELSWREQDELLKSIHDAKPMPGAEGIWQRMPIHRYWGLVIQDCVEIYYAHPWAWDEIGFGGPAYPRAYIRLERGEPEPWEVEERRYDWIGPPFACPISRGRNRSAQRTSGGRAGRHPLKTPIGGEFEVPQDHHHHLGPMQRLDAPMRCYSENEEVDYLVVGVGSAGGVLLQRLARAGFRVLGLEAGPFWDTERDWVSDEKGSHQLYWEDMRITGGKNPLVFGANNSGKGVGGGSVALGGIHAALSSVGLRGLHARRRRRGLADFVLGFETVLRTS